MSIISLPLTVHQLIFVGEATTALEFGPQAGAQLRGALWEALRESVICEDARARTPEHVRFCPLCRLILMEAQESPRGANPPRPFAIRPPLNFDAQNRIRINAGETVRFGVNLYGDAEQLFPYVCQAVYKIGQIGVGYGRGTFLLQTAEAVNPFTGEAQMVYSEHKLRGLPSVPIRHDSIEQAIRGWSNDHITLDWQTPCELTDQGRPTSVPDLAVITGRLIERCQMLELHYTPDPAPTTDWRELHLQLQAQAKKVTLTENATRWNHVLSGSNRTQTMKPVSGLVGKARYEGDVSTLRYWLAWGSALHIGKNVVKGNGWYEIS